jgi:hypothetical protein
MACAAAAKASKDKSNRCISQRFAGFRNGRHPHFQPLLLLQLPRLGGGQGVEGQQAKGTKFGSKAVQLLLLFFCFAANKTVLGKHPQCKICRGSALFLKTPDF